VQVERDGQKIDVLISNDDIAALLKSKSVFSLRYPFQFTVRDFAKDSPGKRLDCSRATRLQV
jgi:regulator of sigma E protease